MLFKKSTFKMLPISNEKLFLKRKNKFTNLYFNKREKGNKLDRVLKKRLKANQK